MGKKPLLKCKRCELHISHPLISSTSSEIVDKQTRGPYTTMIQHLSKCPKAQSGKQLNKIITELLQSKGSTSKDRKTKEDIVDLVINFFASSKIELHLADNPAVQDIISLIEIDGEPVTISRDVITRRLKEKGVERLEDAMELDLELGLLR